MTAPAAPALRLEAVRAGYGGNDVLRDVDLVVEPGTAVALLGANGAGKTTLLRTASGLLPTRSGSVQCAGVDLTAAPPEKRAARGLCHIPEGRGVFPSMTTKENLVLFSPPGRHRACIEQATEAFPSLAKRLDVAAGSLSGGEQQMLSIVRAYISRPRIVLVDEASMGLAPVLVDQIFEFMNRIRKEGTALLIVEQYVHRALDLADFVYVLNRGEIVYSGMPADTNVDDLYRRYLGLEIAVEEAASGHSVE